MPRNTHLVQGIGAQINQGTIGIRQGNIGINLGAMFNEYAQYLDTDTSPETDITRYNPIRRQGQAYPEPRFYNDAFEEDNERGANFRVDNIPKNRKDINKEITVSDDCKQVIHDISNKLLYDQLMLIKEIYNDRIRQIESLIVPAILEAFNDNRDRAIYSEFESIVTSVSALTNNCSIDNNTDSLFLSRVERKAYEMFDLEHSKYRFYPRLKAKMEKYGNPELLAEILTVTQIGKGKVLWK